MDYTDFLDAGSLTAGVLLAITVLMILNGKLVPVRFYRDLRERLESEIRAKEEWREAYLDMKDHNTLLLQNDDVATTAVRQVHRLAAKQAQHPEGGDEQP